MGIEIDFIKHVEGKPVYSGYDNQVSGWDTCGLILEMTHLWYDKNRDSDREPYWQQVSINQLALEKANYVLPWTFSKYLEWRSATLGHTSSRKFGYDYAQELDFDRARDFIRTACLNGHGAMVSY